MSGATCVFLPSRSACFGAIVENVPYNFRKWEQPQALNANRQFRGWARRLGRSRQPPPNCNQSGFVNVVP